MSKAQAIKKLGKEDDYINLAGFNTERDIAQKTYDQGYNKLQTEYNSLIEEANRNKVKAKSDFISNKNLIDRNEYMATRGKTGSDLSSRGLSKGFKSAEQFANTLQRNNANSTLANTYYNSMADIQRQIDTDTQNFNYNTDSLKLNLDSSLANIAAREAAARNDYRAKVAQLAEQIQAREDAKAAANRQYKLQLDEAQRRLAEGYITDEKLLNDSNYIVNEANRVLNSGKAKLIDSKGNLVPVTTTGDALKWLEQNNRYRLSDVQAATKQSWEDLQKKKQTQELLSLKNLLNIL